MTGGRRALGRAAAGVLGALALLVGVSPGPAAGGDGGLRPAAAAGSAQADAPPVTAAGSAQADARPDPVITITGLDPRAPTVDDVLVVRGTVTNPVADPAATALRSLRIRLRVSAQPLRSRSELASEARSRAPVGSPVDDPGAAATLADLPPGGRAAFRLTAPVRTLRLPGLGVYPLGVDLRGDDGSGVETLARVRTWLPFGPVKAGVAPTRIAWLWPLLAVPNRNPDGTFPDENLAAELRPGGRLAVLVDQAAAATAATRGRGTPPARVLPLSYAVDPALLEAVAAMADGYTVRLPDGRTARGTGQAAARGWLAHLRRLAATDPVIALPYADPDIVALVRAGRSNQVGLAAASATFGRLVRDVLGTAPVERVAWPPGGMVTQAALDALTGVDTVVLDGAALPPLPQISYTPDAATTLPAAAGGTLRALVSDPTLAQLVAAGPAAGSDPAGGIRLAEQRFLAETLMITAEKPALSRAVLIAPPRRWAPQAAWAAALLRDSAAVPWLQPTALAALRAPAAADGRGPLTYPAAAERAELPAAVLGRGGGIGIISRQLATYQAILTNPEAAGVPEIERALLRSESAAWRTDPTGGMRMRNATSRMLSTLSGRVRITTRGEVSLASKRSTIPVSVANGLPQPIRVQVALHSTAARLVAEDSGVKVISGGHQIQLSVGLTAPAVGVFPVTASLLTPEGRPYGSAVKLLVHATRYGTLALAITAVAFVVLGFAVALRLVRRLRGPRVPGAAR